MYFFWQMHRIDQSMQNNALERSRMVSEIIEENLRNAELASEAIEQIAFTLLNDKAHFFEYLDSIEPLHESELTALAAQSGLAGITLVRKTRNTVSGPPNWLNSIPECQVLPKILYDHQHGTAYMTHPMDEPGRDLSCIIVGMKASKIFSVQEKTSLSAILSTLSSLPGIHYIKISKQAGSGDKKIPSVTLTKSEHGHTAEAIQRTSKGFLIVGLDAKHFIQRRRSMRNQFFIFGGILLGAGFVFSWLLYRYQRKNLEQAKIFERMMAREHEAATLGRATATIAHEVRNPLNAINMGLQRLSLESDNLTEEQTELIQAMLEGVDRTSTIVTELNRFTRELQPKQQSLRLDKIIRQQLTLYQAVC